VSAAGARICRRLHTLARADQGAPLAVAPGMFGFWKKKPKVPAAARCPSCRSADTVEVERAGSATSFQCVNCWELFVIDGASRRDAAHR
jgi:hypothetical protein